MFSFFRKKPAPDEGAGAAPSPQAGPATGSSAADQAGKPRPRTALEWLNTDLGELFFRRETPADAGAASAPAAAPTAAPGEPAPPVAPASSAAPPVAPPPVTPGTPPPVTPGTPPPATPGTPPPATPGTPPPVTPGTPPPAAASADDEPAASVANRADWIARLRGGLRKTGSSLAQAFVGASIGDELYDDLEAALLQADAGAAATRFLLDDLKSRVRRAEASDAAAVRRLLAQCSPTCSRRSRRRWSSASTCRR